MFVIFFQLVDTFLNFIKPGNKTRVFWDLTSILITCGQLWYIPLISSFPDINPEDFSVVFQEIPLIIFTFDILFNFVTGYYSKGFWVEDKYRIAKHYLKKEFWLDIVTLIPIYIVYTYDGTDRPWSLIFLFRVIRMKKLFERIQDHFQLKKMNYISILNLLTLGLNVVFSVHLGACFWHYQCINNLNAQADKTWLAYYQLVYEPWLVRYVNCFYFIIVTIVTVGYGDFSPQNTLEKQFICIFILIGCGQFGYCLNKIGSIFQQMFESEAKLQY